MTSTPQRSLCSCTDGSRLCEWCRNMVYMHNTMQKQLDELTAENIRMSKNHKVINDANTVLKTKLLAANAENLDLKEKVNPSTSEIPVLEKKLQAYEDKHFAKSQRNRCFASTFTFFGFLFWAAFWLFSEMPFCVLGAWLMLFLACFFILVLVDDEFYTTCGVAPILFD